MKKWVVYKKKSDNLIDQLLINRGIELKDKEQFLNPRYEDLYDPFLLKDMNKAVKRIIAAIENKETIGIFADYDADGIPGGAILANFFSYLKTKTSVYIPSREEGYGLNEKGIRELSLRGCRLLITVDLGITGKKEVEFAKSLRMETIVTDHHLFEEKKIPRALAVIHPRLAPKYPNKDLAGGAVAFKLIQAVAKELGKPSPDQLKWFLDLAAISTICDLVPLSGENRIMAKYGMKVLAKTKNLGLEALMKVAGVNKEAISTYTLGFQIGPRINAPGRMNHSQISYFLLTTRNSDEAATMAKKLNQINAERQQELERAMQEAEEKIVRNKLAKNKIILLSDSRWSEGIIGLVAGKLMEKLWRPIIIFKEDGQFLQGSARSMEKFPILEILDKSRKLLLKFGGHARAAGLTLKKANFEKFYRNLLKIAEVKLKDEDLIPRINIDAELAVEQVNLKLYQEIKKLEPFGMGNPKPVFLSRGVEISELRWVGKEGKHLKLRFKIEDLRFGSKDSIINHQSSIENSLEAVMFNCSECVKGLQKGNIVDIVYSIEENIWNNFRSVQLNLIDLKQSE